MAYENELRKVRPGWQLTEYIGCDTDENGHANRATADRIVKHWGVTRADANAQAVGE